MIPDYDRLRAHIESEQLTGTAEAIAAALNAPRKVGVRIHDLPMAAVANALNSKFANVIDAARTGNKGAQAFIELLRSGGLSTNATAAVDAVNALVADGTLTVADRAALASAATDDVLRPPAQDAELFGPDMVILPRHVEEALSL